MIIALWSYSYIINSIYNVYFIYKLTLYINILFFGIQILLYLNSDKMDND